MPETCIETSVEIPVNSFVAVNPYNTAKIYALKTSHNPKFYIGSTCLSLNIRLRNHKGAYNKYNNGTSTLYSTAYEILKHTDAYIELLEEVNVVNNIELRLKEKEHFLKHKDNIVNKNNPMQTKEEKKKQMDWHNTHRKNEKKLCQYCKKEVLKYNFKTHLKSASHIFNESVVIHPELFIKMEGGFNGFREFRDDLKNQPTISV